MIKAPFGRWLMLVACCEVAVCAVQVQAALIDKTVVVAVTGDPAPDGNGRFGPVPGSGFTFDVPLINDVGQVAFRAYLTGTSGGNNDNLVALRSDGSSLVQIARVGQLVSGVTSSLRTINLLSLNNAGQVSFTGCLNSGVSCPSIGTESIVRGDGGPLNVIAVRGHPVPGSGVFSSFDTEPALNDAGQVAFRANLSGTLGGSSDNLGIFRSDGTSLVAIAREGKVFPAEAHPIQSFSIFLVLNNLGQVAFHAESNYAEDEGIFRGDGTSISQIARHGQPVPKGIGTFNNFDIPGVAINNAGQVAFWASISDTGTSTNTGEGIFRGDGASLIQIARIGEGAPDGNGKFGNLKTLYGGWNVPALNSLGQVAFVSGLAGTTGGIHDNIGILRGDGISSVVVARKGQFAPDGNGKLDSFDTRTFTPAMNDVGQIAFLAYLTDTSQGIRDDKAIYLFDDKLGLVQVAREGSPYLGSTIKNLDFASSFPSADRLGMSRRGPVKLAYWFALADGREGIAVWSLVPEPGGFSLVCFAFGGVAVIFSRSRS